MKTQKKRKAVGIHFVEKAIEFENLRCIDGARGEWETGYWVVGDNTAQSLLGGKVFIHRLQSAPSHAGGIITSFYHELGTDKKRKVFRFLSQPDAQGVVAERTGWGNEKKVDWSGDGS